jgi:hypothetical protein
MHDLERRTQQLLCDWQALRQSLECVPQDQLGAPFFHTQLDVIEASIVALPEIIDCIKRCSASSADGETRAHMGQHASAPHDQALPHGSRSGGLGARLRRIRQTEQIGNDYCWHGPSAGGG